MGSQRERYFMMQEAVDGADGVPQRGTLLRRAHELLESIGQPTAEDLLIQHLFGVSEGTTGRPAVWTMLLRQTLQSSSLFEQVDEQHWSLSAWRSTQLSLDEVEFVVLDTETTGLRPGPNRVIEIAGIRLQFQLLYLRSEEHTSELQSLAYLVCRLLLEKKKK